MLKILLPVDGSPHALRAAEGVAKLAGCVGAVEIHLLSVRIPIDSGHARMFVTPEEVEAFHREEGLADMAGARALLEAAGLSATQHVLVGHVAPTIARFADEHGFDLIAMGSHGRSALSHLLLGSVTSEVIRHTHVPVTVIR